MDFFEHGGNSKTENIICDFSANINPLGLPTSAVTILKNNWRDVQEYPEIRSQSLRSDIAKQWNINREKVICGNGASELIYSIVHTVVPHTGIILAPTFSEYERALLSVGSNIVLYNLRIENDYRIEEDILELLSKQEKGSMLFLCNPNNPVGNLVDNKLLEEIIILCNKQEILLVIDECFLPFNKEYEKHSVKQYFLVYDNVFILNAFTKLYAMPGLRLGYGITSNEELIEKMYSRLPAWNVSILAQQVGLAVLEDNEYVEKSVNYIEVEREFLTIKMNTFKNIISKVYEGSANYIFFEGIEGLDNILADKGIIIRSCENYRNLDKSYYRIAVRTREENEILISALEEEEQKWQRI